jgi:hypothetical protein
MAGYLFEMGGAPLGEFILFLDLPFSKRYAGKDKKEKDSRG